MSLPRRVVVAGVMIVGVLAIGCSREYAGASDRTYEIATALVSICERKQVEKLDTLEELIVEGVDSGDVSEAEATYLREMIKLAADEQWQEAKAEARQVLSHQVDGA